MNLAVTLYNRGIALHNANRFAEALASYDQALALKPDFAEAYYGRGISLWGLGRIDDALASTEKALALKPRYVEAVYNRGVLLQTLRRPEKALAAFEAALVLKPSFIEAHHNRATALWSLGRFEDALASCDAALELDPSSASMAYNRGALLEYLERFEEAQASYERALTLNPRHPDAFGCLASAALHALDWTRTASLAGALDAHVRERRSIVAPLTYLRYSDDAALQLQCARNYIAHRIRVRPPPLWTGARYGHERIRLAYLSSDFQSHPVAFQTAELFERHDRARFELIGISVGPDDGGEMRARLRKSFDRFHEVRADSDAETARLLCRLEADIVVDLGGHTHGSRPEILSHRPAPVAASYLGYPGTMAADFVDYVIADRVVLPFAQQPFFTEKIVHLPDSFWVSDATREIGPTPARAEAGLPERGFVFCSFNNHWKITAPVFDVWMRLLGAVPESVLWLRQAPVGAMANLRREAAARGVDPARLVFVGRAPALGDHLARQRLADLFLDTLPYNAHATASDALWAGLPVVTCLGKTFPGRVAASLLHAAGVPELVADNLADYEALALKLARDSALLESLRGRLRERAGHALFDTGRLRRHLEAAYTRMWEIAERGEPPQSFTVTSDAG